MKNVLLASVFMVSSLAFATGEEQKPVDPAATKTIEQTEKEVVKDAHNNTVSKKMKKKSAKVKVDGEKESWRQLVVSTYVSGVAAPPVVALS